MSKFLALFIFFAVSFLGFYSNASVSKDIFATVTPTATPTPKSPSDLFKMELDRDTFVAPCPPNYKCRQSDTYSAPFVVTISNAERKDDSLRYNYTTSGGRIIGEGARVNWDLTGAAPGTYTITVAITDNLRVRLQTATGSITVIDYQDDGDRCLGACPSLSVDAPSLPVQAGETMMFTANVSGGVVDKIFYDWTISDGKIVEGQGTPVIRVATNPKMAGKTVEATANFKWDSDCWEICNKTASASGSIAAKKRGKK